MWLRTLAACTVLTVQPAYDAAGSLPSAVNGQVAVPGGGQLKVPTPRADSVLVQGGSSSCPGFAHAVGIAVGDDDVGVVQEAVQKADRGGVLGQEPAPLVEWPVAGHPE